MGSRVLPGRGAGGGGGGKVSQWQVVSTLGLRPQNLDFKLEA